MRKQRTTYLTYKEFSEIAYYHYGISFEELNNRENLYTGKLTLRQWLRYIIRTYDRYANEFPDEVDICNSIKQDVLIPCYEWWFEITC